MKPIYGVILILAFGLFVFPVLYFTGNDDKNSVTFPDVPASSPVSAKKRSPASASSKKTGGIPADIAQYLPRPEISVSPVESKEANKEMGKDESVLPLAEGTGGALDKELTPGSNLKSLENDPALMDRAAAYLNRHGSTTESQRALINEAYQKYTGTMPTEFQQQEAMEWLRQLPSR